MIEISSLVNSLSPSQTLAMSQKSAELRAQGVDVINLSVGEPDFNTPAHIKEAAKRAIDENYTRYTPVAGYKELREAIACDMRRHPGVDFTADDIVVSNGAKQSLCNAILATINPGDEVIIPAPAWVSYSEMVKLAHGTSVIVESGIEDDFKMTPEKLEKAITPKTRMLLLTSPSNPTGSVYTRAELQDLVDVLARHERVLVLADEIYEHINFTGSFTSMASFPAIADRTAIVNGVSKAYAMTGWRIGYIAAPAEVAKAVSKLQGQMTSGASSIAQKAAEAAYLGPQECVEEMRQAFERRRDLICQLAAEIPGWKAARPDGAFYLFPDVTALLGTHVGDRRIDTSADYVMYLLEEANVGTVDGGAFCAPGYIRLSFATSDDNIRKAMARIKEATAKLQK